VGLPCRSMLLPPLSAVLVASTVAQLLLPVPPSASGAPPEVLRRGEGPRVPNVTGNGTMQPRAATRSLAGYGNEEWAGIVAELSHGCDVIHKKWNMTSTAFLLFGLAAILVGVVPLRRLPRRLDFDFESPPRAPDGVLLKQPLRLLPAPDGVYFQGVALLLGIAVDFNNMWTVASNGLLLPTCLAIVVHVRTLFLQAQLVDWNPLMFVSELYSTAYQGGINTPIWSKLHSVEHLLEVPATALITMPLLMWVPAPTMFQTLSAFLGLLLAARTLAQQAMARVLGSRAPRNSHEVAARSFISKESSMSDYKLGALNGFYAAAIAATLAGFTVVSRILHPAVAFAMYLPQCFAVVGQFQEDDVRAMMLPGSRVALTLVEHILPLPLIFLAPGGLAGHSLLGLNPKAYSPRFVYCTQVVWHIVAAFLCCIPFPTVLGRDFGGSVLEQEFLMPLRGFIWGGVQRDLLKRAVLRSGMLCIWTSCAVVQIVVIAGMLCCCPKYMNGGPDARNDSLLKSVKRKEEELNLWCRARQRDRWQPEQPGCLPLFMSPGLTCRVGDWVCAVFEGPEHADSLSEERALIKPGSESIFHGEVLAQGEDYDHLFVKFWLRESARDVLSRHLIRVNEVSLAQRRWLLALPFGVPQDERWMWHLLDQPYWDLGTDVARRYLEVERREVESGVLASIEDFRCAFIDPWLARLPQPDLQCETPRLQRCERAGLQPVCCTTIRAMPRWSARGLLSRLMHRASKPAAIEEAESAIEEAESAIEEAERLEPEEPRGSNYWTPAPDSEEFLAVYREVEKEFLQRKAFVEGCRVEREKPAIRNQQLVTEFWCGLLFSRISQEAIQREIPDEDGEVLDEAAEDSSGASPGRDSSHDHIIIHAPLSAEARPLPYAPLLDRDSVSTTSETSERKPPRERSAKEKLEYTRRWELQMRSLEHAAASLEQAPRRATLSEWSEDGSPAPPCARAVRRWDAQHGQNINI